MILDLIPEVWSYSPAKIINSQIEKKIIDRIVKPTLKALRNKKSYRGFLYVGLMIKNSNPYLIEYNVRMGDPECQVILPRLKSDIVKIFDSVVKNKLQSIKIKWRKENCMTIVLCSKGYPGIYSKNKNLKNLDKIKLKRDDFIFHAGTKEINGKIFSNGGRVLNFTSLGNNFFKIRNRIIKLIRRLNWKNGFFRTDIGWRVIQNNENNKRKIQR